MFNRTQNSLTPQQFQHIENLRNLELRSEPRAIVYLKHFGAAHIPRSTLLIAKAGQRAHTL
jgi:hypothetical protein